MSTATATAPFATSDNVSLDQNAQPYVKALKSAAASDGAFLHYPRPPGIPGALPFMRDYLNHIGTGTPSRYLNTAGDELSVDQFLQLNRKKGERFAGLAHHNQYGYMHMQLTPNALRELARMCIDAAHDIEVNP